jgi:hypothetical protein
LRFAGQSLAACFSCGGLQGEGSTQAMTIFLAVLAMIYIPPIVFAVSELLRYETERRR